MKRETVKIQENSINRYYFFCISRRVDCEIILFDFFYMVYLHSVQHIPLI